MALTKSPEWLVEAFDGIAPIDPRVERRKTFGFPSAYAGGNMFLSLFQDSLVMRLPEGDRERFLEEYKTGLFKPSPNQVMREYVVVPLDLIRNPAALEPWTHRSLEYAATLKPKVKKKAAAKAGAKKKPAAKPS
jgi:TfoX/Sxy family transcriptional regulator of competence genes